MRIRIKKLKDAGDFERERLLLEVLVDDDIGRYAVFATTSAEDGGVSNKVEDTFWFPDYEVSAGDLVVLYTKAGVTKVKHNDDGSTSHFFLLGAGTADMGTAGALRGPAPGEGLERIGGRPQLIRPAAA